MKFEKKKFPIKHQTIMMRTRKTQGDLRPSKKTKDEQKIAVTKVFGNFSIIRDYLVPFLDEWSMYNIIRVNKDLSKVVTLIEEERRHMPFIRYSPLSMHFYRHNTCCICFTKLSQQKGDSVNGLFCHSKCIPIPKEWKITNDGIPIPRTNATMGTIVRFFEKKNPCFFDQNTTLSSYIEKNYPIAHTVLFKDEDISTMGKYVSYFNEFTKNKSVSLGYNIKKKVVFHGTKVGVVAVFNHLYPSFYATNEATAIVEKYHEVERLIKNVHTKVHCFYSKQISGLLLHPRTLCAFVQSPVLVNEMNARSFIDFIYKIDGFRQPENIFKFMTDNVFKLRNDQIQKSVLYFLQIYINNIACLCPLCSTPREMNCRTVSKRLAHAIVKDIENNRNNKCMTKTEVRSYVWDRLEVYFDFWILVRDCSSIERTKAHDIPLLFFEKPLETLKQWSIIAACMIKEDYHVNDVHAALMNVGDIDPSRQHVENRVTQIVKHRRVCYCGMKRLGQNQIKFCTSHKLCSRCCKVTHCQEEMID